VEAEDRQSVLEHNISSFEIDLFSQNGTAKYKYTGSD